VCVEPAASAIYRLRSGNIDAKSANIPRFFVLNLERYAPCSKERTPADLVGFVVDRCNDIARIEAKRDAQADPACRRYYELCLMMPFFSEALPSQAPVKRLCSSPAKVSA
jgi:hypothetical protein